MDSAAAAMDFTVSGRFVHTMVGVAETYGVEDRRLLRAANVAADRAQLAALRLAGADAYRIVDAAVELTSDPALGLHWAERSRGSAFTPPMLMLMVRHAPTLRDALDALSTYSGLLTDQPEYRVLEKDGVAYVRCAPRGASERVHRFHVESTLACFSRLLVGFTSRAPEHVSFDYEAPRYRQEYTGIFFGREQFAQPYSQLAFDAVLLDRSSPRGDHEVFHAMRQIAERRMREASDAVSLRQTVVELLLRRAPSARAEMATVARWLRTSPRSLHRRLELEGTVFSELRKEAQARRAMQLLSDTRRTVQEVAWEMGFRSPTNFHHAFKAWTGLTPLGFRGQSSV